MLEGGFDLVMQPDVIIGRRVIDLLTNPLTIDFLRMARNENESWANILVSRVAGILTDTPPETWTLDIHPQHTPALLEAFGKGLNVTVKELTTDPRGSGDALPCVLLYIRHRNNEELLLPDDDTRLQTGDQLLFCGQRHAETHMRWTAHNFNVPVITKTQRLDPHSNKWHAKCMVIVVLPKTCPLQPTRGDMEAAT